MQLLLLADDRTDRLLEIHLRLLRRFGSPGPHVLLDPVSQLVMGMVGGRTRGEVSLKVFIALRQRFRCWEHLRDASISEIHQLIRPVENAEVKAPRLISALQIITSRRQALTLDFLHDLTMPDALNWLEDLPGVGCKTAASVLNFSTLRKRALVIDTHHLRVLRRVGLVGRRVDASKAFDQLMPVLPVAWNVPEVDDHHQLIKKLGQTACRHSRPACRKCPLCDICAASQTCTTSNSEPIHRPSW